MKNINIIQIISLLLLGVASSCSNNITKGDTELIIQEVSKIDNEIKNGVLDSIQEENHIFWFKDGKVSKVSIFNGDGEDYFTKETYYIQDDGSICGYNKRETNFPNGIEYELQLIFDKSKILSENYWWGSVKKKKSELAKLLNERGYSIDGVMQDYDTKKIHGLGLTIKDISIEHRFENYLSVINNVNHNIQHNSDMNNIDFREAQLILLDNTLKKAKIYLDEPDEINYGGLYPISKGFAVYYNRIANIGGKPKHLVLFLRINGNSWGNDAIVEEMYEVDDYEKACFGIHCIEIRDRVIYTNSSYLIQSEGYPSL